MKARELMEEWLVLPNGETLAETCDTCKIGDPEKEVTRVAVAMTATVDIIREAARWGADMMIVHEPTFYDHMEQSEHDPVRQEKYRLLEQTGMVLYRYHDYAHRTTKDTIACGMYRQMGLKGTFEVTGQLALTRFRLDEPITPLELAKRIEERCGVKHVRISGARDALCTRISGMFGVTGAELEELKREESEIVLLGETCEWKCCEYARDAAQLGYKKAILTMGHVGSEWGGVQYIAELLKETHPELTVAYLHCGEVYGYTE